jgi:hypothetical protein
MSWEDYYSESGVHLNESFGGNEKMVPIDAVVLTEEEQQECQSMLRSVTQVEGGGYFATRKGLIDSFKRSVVALCMMGRAERFLILAGCGSLTLPMTAGSRYRSEYGEKACKAAAKACGVFPVSIYFYDFGCVLKQVGKPEEANQMFKEFLRRLETEVPDPIMQSTLNQRDVELAAQLAHQWISE